MKTILVAASMRDFGLRLDAVVEALKALLRTSGRSRQWLVQSASAVDWKRLRIKRHCEGVDDYEAVAAWAANRYDALVLLETTKGGLGRGTYDIAVAFQRLKKPMYVFRSGRALPCRAALESAATRNWKFRWGRIVLLSQEPEPEEPT